VLLIVVLLVLCLWSCLYHADIGDARLADEEVDEMIKVCWRIVSATFVFRRQQVDCCLQYADVDESGQINYEAFVHKLLVPA
jgi:hypothetical protein